MNAHAVHDALTASGADADADAFRQLYAQLGGRLRIAVARRGATSLSLEARSPDVDWVDLEVDEEGLELGMEERLLSSHVVVYLTPAQAPLGQADRAALGHLTASGAPAERYVALSGLAMLERMADDPEAERVAIEARVDHLLPKDWLRRGDLDPADWLQSANDRVEVARRHLASHFLDRRRSTLSEEVETLEAQVQTHRDELARTDEDLQRRVVESRRLAAQILGILRRHTQGLQLDLSDHIAAQSAALHAEVHGSEDLAATRKALPHWLAHQVRSWLTERIDRWMEEVGAELDELEIDADLPLTLVVPGLHPELDKPEARWTERLGTTAAFGGTAALFVLKLWVPGAFALAGSFALSSLLRGPSDAESRDALIAAGRKSLAELGAETHALLEEQLHTLGTHVQRLEDDPAPSQTRDHLEAQLAHRLEELAQARSILDAFPTDLP